MANAKYRKACENYLFPNIVGNTVRASLIRTAAGYTPDIENDEFYQDVPGAAIIFDGPALTGKTFTGGRFKADNLNMGTVPASPSADGIILWHDTGDPATSRLLVWIDTAGGLPVTPNGTDYVVIYWPSNYIFSL